MIDLTPEMRTDLVGSVHPYSWRVGRGATEHHSPCS